MTLQQLTNLARLLPWGLGQKALAVLGALTLLGQIVPWLITKGVPASIRAADYLANLLLSSQAKPFILWKAPAIVDFLDSLTSALIQVMNTFKNRLESDIKAAEAPKQ